MKHSNKTIRFTQIAIAALTASVITTSSAGPFFPPDHRHKEAQFSPAGNSAEGRAEPWYHSAEYGTREQLIAEEVQMASPHPSRYYFTNLRKFGNPGTGRRQRFGSTDSRAKVNIADDSRIKGNES